MRRALLIGLLLISKIVFSQNWNINTLRHINLDRNPTLDNTFKRVTNSISYSTFGTPIVLFASSAFKHDSVGKRKAIYIASSSIIAATFSSILKKTVKETRPFVTYPDIQKLTKAGSESFPSGHTTDAFSLATSLTISFPKWYVAVPAYTYASAVGYSRMHLGVHYPSDVIAGAIIGSGSAFLAHKLNLWIARK